MTEEQAQELLDMPPAEFYTKYLWRNEKLTREQRDKLAVWYEENKNTAAKIAGVFELRE